MMRAARTRGERRWLHARYRARWKGAGRRLARRVPPFAGRARAACGRRRAGAATLFVALALVSYTQTDPSLSTAAGGEVRNWMGLAGAYTAERALFLFGLVAVLFVPMLYAFARKLWRDAEHEETPHGRRWWRTVGLLLLAMALLGTRLRSRTRTWARCPTACPPRGAGSPGCSAPGRSRRSPAPARAAQLWTRSASASPASSPARRSPRGCSRSTGRG
jgi:hypothetical protein